MPGGGWAVNSHAIACVIYILGGLAKTLEEALRELQGVSQLTMGREIKFTDLVGGPQTVPDLARNEVHVWAARMNLGVPPASWLEAALSAEERERGARFRFLPDRHRWFFARCWLRHLLGGYCEMPASAIRFEVGAHGKPHAVGLPIHFNVSHSGEAVLMAFSRHSPVGVDIECVRPMQDWAGIAERYFCASEAAALRGWPDAQQVSAFFRGWTQKEAYLKVTGTGISASLKAVELDLSLTDDARIVSIGGEIKAAADWALYPMAPFANYPGCLAVKSGPWNIQAWRWSEPSGTAISASSQ